MKKTLRTFAAVEITNPVRAKADALIHALADTSADVNWVEPHNLHLTLKFLGDVHQRDIHDICRVIAKSVAKLQPFEIEVCGAGAFPNPARPRTIWLGVTAGADPMVVLHDRVEADLAEIGYREEHRRFQAHLTLGRVRGAGIGISELGDRLQKQADFLAGRMTVEKLTVFASTLTSAGPIYEVLGTAPLGG